MEAGETSLGRLEMRKMLNCYGVNCSEMAVKLFSFADVCECTRVHCIEYTRDAHKRLCTHWIGRTWVWS